PHRGPRRLEDVTGGGPRRGASGAPPPPHPGTPARGPADCPCASERGDESRPRLSPTPLPGRVALRTFVSPVDGTGHRDRPGSFRPRRGARGRGLTERPAEGH